MKINKKSPNLQRCVYVDGNGRRCRRKGKHRLKLFLDPELYQTNWVEVDLCNKHFPLFNDGVTVL